MKKAGNRLKVEPLAPDLCGQMDRRFRGAGLANGIHTAFLKILLAKASPSADPLGDIFAAREIFEKKIESDGLKLKFFEDFDQLELSVLGLVKMGKKRTHDFLRRTAEIADWMVDNYDGDPASFRKELISEARELLASAIYEQKGIKDEKDFSRGIELLSEKLPADILAALLVPYSQALWDPPADKPYPEPPGHFDRICCRVQLLEFINAAVNFALRRPEWDWGH